MGSSTVTMHDIRVIHNWVESHRTLNRDRSSTTSEKCQDCGAVRRVLHLKPRAGPALDDWSNPEVVAERLRVIREMAKASREAFEAIEEDLVQAGNYSTMDDLAGHFANRTQNMASAMELPFNWLEEWVNTPRHLQAKVLLLYKQGPVCNRCDQIFTGRCFELDHIIPDRTRSELTNLQLLCSECHSEKDNNDPDDRDVSPFGYDGDPCVHRVTCMELEPRQQ